MSPAQKSARQFILTAKRRHASAALNEFCAPLTNSRAAKASKLAALGMLPLPIASLASLGSTQIAHIPRYGSPATATARDGFSAAEDQARITQLSEGDRGITNFAPETR